VIFGSLARRIRASALNQTAIEISRSENRLSASVNLGETIRTVLANGKRTLQPPQEVRKNHIFILTKITQKFLSNISAIPPIMYEL